jgi:Terminase large subunit, T4likevirus-type, N-terminal
MVALKDDLRFALDRVAFARYAGSNLKRRRTFEPDPWQERLLRSIHKRILLNCSRQSGKSTTTSIIALHKALYEPGTLTLCIGPAERQAKEFFAKVSRFYHALGGQVSAESVRKLGLTLDNGSRIEALPGSEKTIRGFSEVDLLILDEASRIDDALYYSVRPMLAVSDGSLMMLSTPWGKRGVFFEEWTGDGDWDRYEVSATDCPRITAEFLEEERRRLPERLYFQEYFNKFVETEDSVFDYDAVEAAIDESIAPLFGEAKTSLDGPLSEEVKPLPLSGGSSIYE